MLKSLDVWKLELLESIEINWTQALSLLEAEAALRPWTLYLILTNSGVSQPLILGRAFCQWIMG